MFRFVILHSHLLRPKTFLLVVLGLRKRYALLRSFWTSEKIKPSVPIHQTPATGKCGTRSHSLLRKCDEKQLSGSQNTP